MRQNSIRAVALAFALGVAIGVAPSVSAGCAMRGSVDTVGQRRVAVVKAADIIESVGLIAEQAQKLEISWYTAGAIPSSAHQRIQTAFLQSAQAVQAALTVTRASVAIDATTDTAIKKAFDALDALLREVTASLPADPNHPARVVLTTLNAARLVLTGATALMTNSSD